MNANGHIDEEDLALYAMHSLTQEESSSISAHVASCETCSGELAALRSDLGLYAQSVELVEVPAGSRERFLERMVSEPRAQASAFATPGSPAVSASQMTAAQVATGPALVARRGPVRTVAPWIGWALAAGISMFAVHLVQDRDALRAGFNSQSGQIAQLSAENATARQVMDTLTDKSAMRVSMSHSTAPKVPTGRATYVASKGSLLFLASNMEPLAPSKVYELWLLPADGSKPVPAGTFEPDARGNGSVVLPHLPVGLEAKAFAVTVENQGGSTTPTAPILMVGS